MVRFGNRFAGLDQEPVGSAYVVQSWETKPLGSGNGSGLKHEDTKYRHEQCKSCASPVTNKNIVSN
jgi:hypothetical protein